MVSTNRAFRDWGAIFDVDNTPATAMIDRLMHHREAIVSLPADNRVPFVIET